MKHKQSLIVAASILTADFLNLKSELDRIISAGIKTIHYDVMDNHFVNNLSFGPKILSDICQYVEQFGVTVDCHFMVTIPNHSDMVTFLKPYQIAGVKKVIFHYEALTEQQRHQLLNEITMFKIGLAFNPTTDVKQIMPFLLHVDLILVMAVNPGFGKQLFIHNTYEKIQAIKQYLIKTKTEKTPIIAVDGGINDITGRLCQQAGANYLVSGSYLLNSNDIKKQLKQLTHE